MDGVLQIGVDREKEPFPLQREEGTYFLYKDKFYVVADVWITFAGCEPYAEATVMLVSGVGLGLGWFFTGVLFLKGRKKE